MPRALHSLAARARMVSLTAADSCSELADRVASKSALSSSLASQCLLSNIGRTFSALHLVLIPVESCLAEVSAV